MKEDLKKKLKMLADKYEVPAFIEKDPSQFMHRFSDVRNQEIAAFISANLAFGNRKQILQHIEIILNSAGADISSWILSEKYKSLFPLTEKSFYRVYTCKDMNLFFEGIKNILKEYGSLGLAFRKAYEKNTNLYLSQLIPEFFDKECKLVARGKNGAAKKLNMFLRWMVRNNSPVDLGLWTDWYPKEKLLMPLDTHVMQEATKFGLIPSKADGSIQAASLKTAVALTKEMEEAFPGDPVRGDFALFGLGVDE